MEEEETVPCTICGNKTTFTGTKLCQNCWEINHRLDCANGKALRYFRDKILGLVNGLAQRDFGETD